LALIFFIAVATFSLDTLPLFTDFCIPEYAFDAALVVLLGFVLAYGSNFQGFFLTNDFIFLGSFSVFLPV